MLHNIFGRNESGARFLELYQQSILARQVGMESKWANRKKGETWWWRCVIIIGERRELFLLKTFVLIENLEK